MGVRNEFGSDLDKGTSSLAFDLPALAAAPPLRAYSSECASSRRLYQVPYASSAGVNQRIRGELLHIRVRNGDYPNSQLSAISCDVSQRVINPAKSQSVSSYWQWAPALSSTVKRMRVFGQMRWS
jgi:hypothetical protein